MRSPPAAAAAASARPTPKGLPEPATTDPWRRRSAAGHRVDPQAVWRIDEQRRDRLPADRGGATDLQFVVGRIRSIPGSGVDHQIGLRQQAGRWREARDARVAEPRQGYAELGRQQGAHGDRPDDDQPPLAWTG